jgi:hypothetical protein
VSDRPDAASEARIARILTAKGRDALQYLRRTRRERFLRELQADGVPLPAVVAIVDRHEMRLASDELQAVLADLVAPVSSPRTQRFGPTDDLSYSGLISGQYAATTAPAN